MEIKTLKTESDFIKFIENKFKSGEWALALKYGERGYELGENKKSFILVEGSMNLIEKENKALYDFIDNNYEWGFDDEWVICYDESTAYRTEPDSYHWEQSFRYSSHGEMITPETDFDEWVEYANIDKNNLDELKNRIPVLPTSNIITDIEEKLIGLGWVELDEVFESGLHIGMNDKPDVIANNLFKEGKSNIIFQLDYTSQFSIGFKVWFKD